MMNVLYLSLKDCVVKLVDVSKGGRKRLPWRLKVSRNRSKTGPAVSSGNM